MSSLKAFIPRKKSGKTIKKLLKNKVISNMQEGVYKIIWPKNCILKTKPEYLLLIILNSKAMKEDQAVGVYPLKQKKGEERGKYTYMNSKPYESVSGIGYVKPLEKISLQDVISAINHNYNPWRSEADPYYNFNLKRVGGLEKLASDMDPLVEVAKRPTKIPYNEYR